MRVGVINLYGKYIDFHMILIHFPEVTNKIASYAN